MKYRNRLIDEVLKFRLSAKGAVLITGPKWCGKTTTAKMISNSEINLQDPLMKDQYIRLGNVNPVALLIGKTPRLIDEWQQIPRLWDAVRQEVDKRQEFNQFILTGSSVPKGLDDISHSGQGRIVSLKMRTMSLFESGDSTGEVSLTSLLNGTQLTSNICKLKFEDYTRLICRGGWPMSLVNNERISLQQSKDYYQTVLSSDIIEVDGVKRSPKRTRALMKSYARHISTNATNKTMLADVNNDNNSANMSANTLADYLDALEKLFIIEELHPWNENFRSTIRVRQTPMRHFIDPSIATAALGLSPLSLQSDIKTCGFLFESMCIRDLRIYADSINGEVFHYHDNTNLEIDAILHLDDNRWAAIEIKLGINEIPKAIKNLNKLEEKIGQKPAFKMILTATEYAYLDESGVWIVPLGLLRN